MSIFFDFNVNASGRMFRRAVDQDQLDIELFWDKKETETLFSVTTLGPLIELATLSICMIDKDKKVTGFMALCDHPPIPSVDPADWEVWMRNMFQEEDNDEIVQIMDKHSPKLVELYGEYYISEVLARHPEGKRKVIVAEEHEKVVGVMCLNEDINYKKLQAMYELGPYHGLLRMTPLDQEKMKRNNSLLTIYGEPIMTGQWTAFDNAAGLEDDSEFNIDDKQKRGRRQSTRPSRVNFSRAANTSVDSEMHHDSQDNYDLSNKTKLFEYSLLGITDSSLMVLMDDEPFDYEIVNIDARFLSLPEVPSIDTMRNECRFPENFQTRNKKKSIVDYESSTQYEGTPNAFVIELFGWESSVHDCRSFDLLEAAFECMPDYEYCIIRVPSADKGFALLQHFCFVPSKPYMCCRDSLYVAHRNSVYGKLRVRKAEFADIPQIAKFLANVDGRQIIRSIERSIAGKELHTAFLLQCELSIVGLAILDPPEYIELIKAKFVLDYFQQTKYHTLGQGVDSGFVLLKTAIAYPVFEPHFSFFAREMLRLSGNNTLVWLTAYRNKLMANNANALVSAMTPLPFRKTAESGLLSELRHVYKLSKELFSFSSWFTTRKLSSIVKMNIDSRIVVIGASRTAIAFLNDLIFGDSAEYLTFTNVTLVSTNGLPYVRNQMRAASFMFPRYQNTTDRFLKSTPFTYYVNVVQGTMTEINKRENYIVTDQGGKLYFDLLFLFIGKQYQHPDYLKSLREKEMQFKLGKVPQYIRADDPKFLQTQLEPATEYDTPENVFFVNTMVDATTALHIVKTLTNRFKTSKICVYGATIGAYCCITALLEMQIPAENIVFVEPFPPEDVTKPRVSVFCNEKVDQSVNHFLDTLGITVYRGYYFHMWSSDEDHFLCSVDLISQIHFIRIQCQALFFYGKRNINPHAFVAINRCGIAYDGGILIDNRFRTNNPLIYAAGPATRYYRRYNAYDNSQKFYDSYEVGKTLGTQIRNQLDPLFTEAKGGELRKESFFDHGSKCSINSFKEEREKQLPKFKHPLFKYCTLPGGLQYLDVRPPGFKCPHYYIQSLEYNGIILETFESGYFKLHLTNDLVVDGITCLTPASYSIDNFKRLYGMSSIMLNNLYTRFTTGKIKDFFDHFKAPWSVYIYNERAKELLALIKYLGPKDDPQGKTLEETLRSIGNEIKDNVEPEFAAKLYLRKSFERQKYFEAIAEFVMEWLNDHDLIFSLSWLAPNMVTYK